MVKAYYNYVIEQSFGNIISSVSPEPKFIHIKSKIYLATSCNEHVIISSTKTNQIIQKIMQEPTNLIAFVTEFIFVEKNCKFYVGYSNGDIVVFNMNENRQENKFTNNQKPIIGIYYVENGMSEFILSSSQSNQVCVYDLHMGELIITLKEHTGSVIGLHFFSNFEKIVTVCKDGILRFWNFSNFVLEKSMVTAKSDLSGSLIVNRADTKKEILVLSCSDNEILLIDLKKSLNENKIEILKRSSYKKIVQLKLLEDKILALTENQFLEVYSVLDLKEVTKKYKRKVKRSLKDLTDFETYFGHIANHFVFEFELKSPENSKRFAVSSRNITGKNVDLAFFSGKNSYKSAILNFIEKKLENLRFIDNFGHNHPISFIAMSSDDFYLISGSADSVCVWELQNCTLVTKFAIENSTAGVFLPGDRYVLVSNSFGSIILIDLNLREIISTLDTNQKSEKTDSKITAIVDIRSATSSKTNKIEIFAISSSFSVFAFSLIKKNDTLELKQVFHQKLNEEPLRIKFSSDCRFIYVSFLNNSIKKYHSDSFKEILTMYGHALPISDFDISTDNYILASISLDKTIRIWDQDFGNCRRIINKVHENGGLKIQLIRNTHYAITSGKEQIIKLWDLDSFELVAVFESIFGHEIRALMSSAEGLFFVAGGGNRILKKFSQNKDQIFAIEVRDLMQEEEFVHEELKTGDKEISRETLLKKYQNIKTAEDIMELIDEVESNQGNEQRNFELELVGLKKREKPCFVDSEGKNPAEIVLEKLDNILKSELCGILDFLHFRHCEFLLLYINYAVENKCYQSLCFILTNFILQKQKKNISQSSTAQKTAKKIVTKMTFFFEDCLKKGTFNIAALTMNINEIKSVNFK